MNSYDDQRFEMVRICAAILTTHATELASIPAAKDEADWLAGRLLVVTTLANRANENLAATTAAKAALTELLIPAALRISEPAAAYAYLRGNVELEKILGISETALRQTKDAFIDDEAQTIHDKVAPILAAEQAISPGALPRPIHAFGIAAPLLADLQRLILAYTAAVDSPRNAQIQLKSVNEAIPAELTAINDRLTRAMDRLMVIFKNSGTGLYSEWFNGRVIKRSSGDTEEKTPPPATPAPPTV